MAPRTMLEYILGKAKLVKYVRQVHEMPEDEVQKLVESTVRLLPAFTAENVSNREWHPSHEDILTARDLLPPFFEPQSSTALSHPPGMLSSVFV